MDAMSIFAAWLAVFSIAFTFMPIMAILEWKKRGTADGFSSVNFVLPVLMMSCWLRHGWMTGDKMNMMINGINIVFFTGYISAFAYYQPKRRYLSGQLIALGISLYAIFTYVDMQEPANASDIMGGIAAGSQIVGLLGGVYEIKRAISLGTTEYLPALFQYAIFLLTVQWLTFGVLAGNQYIAIANAAGLLVNVATISLYFFYPPLTWRVPLIGTGPQQKEGKKEK